MPETKTSPYYPYYNDGKLKVLFFDDDRVTQEILKSSLEEEFEVVCETSGSKAIETAEFVQPHIILLDLSMPNVDGFEVLKRLKSHPTLSAIPIICVSGKQDEASRTRCYGLGASGFISKPIDVDQISSDIKSLLKSMNIELISSDRRKEIFVGFNSNSMMSRLRLDLRTYLDRGEKVVLLSLQEGSSFFENANFEKELQDNSLLYLQIKPNLITRLPYLEDLSPLIDDINQFFESRGESIILFFERPEMVLEGCGQDRQIASTIMLSGSLNKNFQSVRYYSVTAVDPAKSANLSTFIKILIGSSQSQIGAA